MSAGKVVTVSDAEFEASVVQNEKPVIVDFWAEWCQPCKMLAPTVEEIANEYDDKMLVTKLNVDDSYLPAPDESHPASADNCHPFRT